MSKLSPKKILSQLSQELLHFGVESNHKKMQAILMLNSIQHLKSKQIKEYFRCLLFILAYPEYKAEYKLAKLSLIQLSDKIRHQGSKVKNELKESGLPSTIMHGVYSYPLIRWLFNSKKIKVQLALIEEGAKHPRESLKNSLNEMEFGIEAQEDLSGIKWIQQAFGTTNRQELMKRLIEHIEGQSISELAKDKLFDEMRLCVRLECAADIPALNFVKTIFTHQKGLLKKFDELEALSEPLPQPKQLNENQKKIILTCARLSLVYLNRETDPVSLCNLSGIEYYELERGFSIALFSAVNNRRLPLESYMGFMMFKNGMPVSYGGAWLFGKRSLLGINIYESFRGGESAFLFSQLLRTYKQRFSPTYIEVEPYQFGKGNPEGIKSGAFWFYYRFGFRPVDRALNAIAHKEYAKIGLEKGYRTSPSVLKSFTNSNMMLRFDKKTINLDPSVISHFITENINSKYNGNRTLFRKLALVELKKELGIDFVRLNKADKIGVEKLYSFVISCLSLSSMSHNHKVLLRQLILEKGNSEFKYAKACEQFPFEDYITPIKLRKELRLNY